MKRPLLIGALLLLGTTPILAHAQAPCAKPAVSVDYGTQVIDVDPCQGFLQAVVVEERTLKVKTFDGTTNQQQVTLATIVANGDTYEVLREDVEDRAGAFAAASLGDVYVLSKAP
jgi:hypothetical protein